MQLKEIVKKLPDEPGVYIYRDKNRKIIYVGKSVSLKKRVSSYFSNKNLGPKTNLLIKSIWDIKYIKVFSEFEALLLESELIKKHRPFYNIQAKDDKSPIYIKITNDKIPTIGVTRNGTKKRGNFLIGPFPSVKTTREVLRIIRRIFPYCHHKRLQKNCLYVHLGLCPNPYTDEQTNKNYLKTIENIKKLLTGKRKSLSRQLTQEMDSLASQQKYEEANKIKTQIEKLRSILTTYRAPFEFLNQPTLVDDLNTQRLKALKEILGLTKTPKRIECYDISNIGGQLATGSMVVFENGIAAKHEYRKFKIKLTHTPNDYEMLKEVITRRLKNNWHLPDLIIIDGGRGQLNTVESVLLSHKVTIPIISLAKRLEEIYVPSKIMPILLPKDSPARQLVQNMRDEAHRFAITYHRYLRSQHLLQTTK